MLLPPTAERRLHAGGRHRGRRAGHGDASRRVDDGDGVAAARGRGLVELDARLLVVEAGRDEGGGGRVERESRSNRLGLLRGRGLGRVARERRAFRGAGDGNQVGLGQQVGAELKVVLELEGAAGLELHAERGQGSRLVEVLHAASAAELPVRVLGDREPRRTAVATTAAVVVVVVRHGGGVRRLRIVVVV